MQNTVCEDYVAVSKVVLGKQYRIQGDQWVSYYDADNEMVMVTKLSHADAIRTIVKITEEKIITKFGHNYAINDNLIIQKCPSENYDD